MNPLTVFLAQRNNYFCDVACGRGEMGDSTYAITKSGLLCEFNNRYGFINIVTELWTNLSQSGLKSDSKTHQLDWISDRRAKIGLKSDVKPTKLV